MQVPAPLGYSGRLRARQACVMIQPSSQGGDEALESPLTTLLAWSPAARIVAPLRGH